MSVNLCKPASKNKRYPFKSSPLYRLKGKDKFEKIFHLNLSHTIPLLANTNYRVWINANDREIQAPVGKLAVIHNRIYSLLSRIHLPTYVYSQKGLSYIDNAKAHCGKHNVVKTDISKFYKSITRQDIYKTFKDYFEMSEDIAHSLADIVCFNQSHLPTGSSLSGILAFLSKINMFDEIHKLIEQYNCTLTVYVDDITISGNRATKKLMSEVRQIIKKHGLNTKEEKSKSYSNSSMKMITGVIVFNDEIRLPNSRHLKIKTAIKLVENATGAEFTDAKKRLSGRIQEKINIKKISRLPLVK